MLKELVVNVAPHETRVALLENGTIVEIFIAREDEASIAIYPKPHYHIEEYHIFESLVK